MVHFGRGFAEVIFVGDGLLAELTSASDSAASSLEGNHESIRGQDSGGVLVGRAVDFPWKGGGYSRYARLPIASLSSLP